MAQKVQELLNLDHKSDAITIVLPHTRTLQNTYTGRDRGGQFNSPRKFQAVAIFRQLGVIRLMFSALL